MAGYNAPMADHEPTIRDDGDQDGEALDSELLPDEFPEDRPLASREYGTTEGEQSRPEPLDGRLRREEPDFGADEERATDRAGDGTTSDEDDDQDEVDADDAPDLLSQLDEDGKDIIKDLTAERGRPGDHDDSGQPRSPRSAEEAAIHMVDEDDESR